MPSANVTTETITILPNVTSSEATTLFRNVTQGVTSAQVNVTADSTTTGQTDSSSSTVYFINSDVPRAIRFCQYFIPFCDFLFITKQFSLSYLTDSLLRHNGEIAGDR